jgi:hypothetical protein
MFKAVCVSLLIFNVFCLRAQVTDTTFVEAAVKNVTRLYTHSIKGQTILYNGSEYREPEQTDEEHPFFESNDWVYGSVTYFGEKFDNVPLLYDICTQKVVTENYYNAQEVALVYEKLSQFSLSSHTFIKIRNESVKNSLPASGFYELLYNGPSAVIAKRQKILNEKIIPPSTIEIYYDERNRYFLFRNGSYFQVRNKGSVLKILEDEKRALRQFISRNKISFGRDPGPALQQIAREYDNLKQRQ